MFPPAPCLAAWLLPLLCVGRPSSSSSSSSSSLSCPGGCLCASDIISCSGARLSVWPRDVPVCGVHLDLSHNLLTSLPANWSAPRPLPRLASLLLAGNAIAVVEPDAFALTPHLLHLDLSSNRLAALPAPAFGSGALAGLRVLLLYGNRIAALEPGALGGLRSLRRLYLSGNRLSAFPLELYQGPARPARLELLDLSSNALTRLPVRSLLAPGVWRQGGVYLQGNPLVCDCALRALLEFWCWRRYRPLLDFRAGYPCGPHGGGGGGGGDEGDCSISPQDPQDPPLSGGVYQIEPGDWLTVPCPGLAPPLQENQTVFWLTPGEVLDSSSPGGGDRGDTGLRRLWVLPGGALEIRGALATDSGAYTCVAARGYWPHRECGAGGGGEVSVLVGNESRDGGGADGSGADGGVSGGGRGTEHFNTAFTTLASCVVSIVLVLLYLYLTPCRCRGDRGRGAGQTGCGGRAALLCSDPREAESRERRSNGKRVAFLEPRVGEAGGDRAMPGPAVAMTTEGILKNGGGGGAGSLAGHQEV